MICSILSLKIYQMRKEKTVISDTLFQSFYPFQLQAQMENIRRYDICNFDVHRASYAKQLRSKKHKENLKIFPTDFLNETFVILHQQKKIKQMIINSRCSL